MNKRFITAFTVFSFLVFTFLIVWFVFRTINTRSGNLLSAREELEKLAQTVSSSYLAAGSFGSPYFSEKIMQKIDAAGRLKALVVSTDPRRLEFAYAVSGGYIPTSLDFEKPILEPITFSFNTITEESLSTTAIVPSAEDIRLDAVFGILGRAEVFPIVRELLIGLLSFLLITAILIILYPFISAKAAKVIGPHMAPASVKPETARMRNENVFAAPPAGSAPITTPHRPVAGSPTAAPEDAGDAIGAGGAAESGPPPAVETDTGGLYSPSTELGWEHYLEERLSAELKRAASFDQDLVLLLGCVDGLKRTDSFYTELSQMSREYFNFQDLCFEYGSGGIGIIIPNVDLDQGIERVEGFKDRVDRRLAERNGMQRLTVGMSARNGRLISGKRIIREAKSALRRAEKESAGITAFRVDPEKYRNYIASKKSSIQT